MSTGARSSNEIAIYRLPTLDPVCVGESGHRDWVFDMCWLDDEFLVSGSRDTKMALWRIDSDLAEAPDKADVPTHRYDIRVHNSFQRHEGRAYRSTISDISRFRGQADSAGLCERV